MSDCELFSTLIVTLLVFTILFSILDVDNKEGNESKIIIIYDYSGETVIENPDSYRFGDFGITCTKSGERITASHYKLIDKEAE